MKLANVFCQGVTKIGFQIDDPQVEDLDAWVSLPGGRTDPSDDGVNFTRSKYGRGLKIETPGEVLLWPGTTVIFVWRRPQAVPRSASPN